MDLRVLKPNSRYPKLILGFDFYYRLLQFNGHKRTIQYKYLRPERFDVDSSLISNSRALEKGFSNFLDSQDPLDQVKLTLLIDHVSPNVYSHLSEWTIYD